MMTSLCCVFNIKMNILTCIVCKSVTKISKASVRKVSTESIDNSMKEFRNKLNSAQKVVFLTGTGISEESGLPTFSGPGPVWRNFTSFALTYPPSFLECPSLFWEFYNYRRELAAKARPNEAHIAIANYEMKYRTEKWITTITQNVDSMHARAGSMNVIELHGNLFKTQCTKCGYVEDNTDRPICPALANTGSPEVNAIKADIAPEALPRCAGCDSLLRPSIMWFGECIPQEIQAQAHEAISQCDMCVVVSTPTLLAPATEYPATIAARGAVVAEFNREPIPEKPLYHYYFEGPCVRTLPSALKDSRDYE